MLGQGGADTLQLGGTGSGIFDVSDVGPAQIYREFEIFSVLSGSWTFNGSTLDPWTVAGGTLGGDATIGNVSVLAGGTLAPGASAGELHTRSVTLAAGATYAVEIGGAGAGQFDRLDVSGTVALGGATLNVSLINGFAPTPGATFTIIENDGADPIGGTFAGLPQGTGVIVGGVTFSISYAGGDGNDVVLTVPAVAVELFGDDGDNLLTGGAANDTLHGLDGNDRLIGGLGADTLNGGAGTDTADYLSDGSVTVDLAAGTGTTGTGVDTLTSIERLIGSQFDDTLRGTDGNDILDGAAGVDVINGFGGNDRLEGGSGNDLLFGGDGNDEVIGQSGNDWLDGANGDDLVRGGDGNDSLEGRDGNRTNASLSSGSAAALIRTIRTRQQRLGRCEYVSKSTNTAGPPQADAISDYRRLLRRRCHMRADAFEPNSFTAFSFSRGRFPTSRLPPAEQGTKRRCQAQ